MAEDGDGSLEALGLGVAKWTINPAEPDVLNCVWYGGTEGGDALASPVQSRLRSDGQDIGFPGRLRLFDEDQSVELDVRMASPHWLSIEARDESGTILAQGLGLVDPADPNASLVSWWCGETEPYGVVKYSIADEQTITGYYISRMTPQEPGNDTAVGDTSGGFPGTYTLRSREVNGRTWGPHIWTLRRRGDLIDLTWSEHGKVFCRGVGFVDPDDASSIVATYIPL